MMLKKYGAKSLLITIALLLHITAHSQVLISLLLGDKLNSGKIEFGLDGGFSLSSLSGIDGAKAHDNYNLGFYFDFKMKNPTWIFNTGVRVKSTMGAENIPVYALNDPGLDSSFSGGSVTRKLNYFHVPLTMKYIFKNNLYAQAGLQLGLKYKATDVFTNNIVEEEDLTYKISVKDQYHPLDAGLLAGIGYRLINGNGMNLGIQYYYGLVDVRISDASPDQFNSAWYFNVGIPIGKGKALAEEKE